MNRQEADKFVETSLNQVRRSYEIGSALKCPTAIIMCRKDLKKDGPPSTEVFSEEKPCVAMFAMLDLDDEQSRSVVKRAAFDGDAFAVAVTLEVWMVSLPVGAPQELIDLAKAAREAGELHKLKPPLRREGVRVYIETEDFPLQMFWADIARENPDDENSKGTLGPLEEQQIKLPRPNFKRYLPEIRDGKKTLVVHLPRGLEHLAGLVDKFRQTAQNN